MRREITWRMGVVLDAVVLASLGVPAWLSTPAVVLAAVVVAERVARHRRRGRLDATIAAIAGPVVCLIGLGFVLDVVPGGITRTSWALGAGVLALAALALCARRPVPPPVWAGTSFGSPTAVVWGGVTVALVATALGISVESARRLEEPPVQLSLKTSGGVTRALVSAGGDAGPFVLRAESGSRATVLSGSFSLEAGQTMSFPVLVQGGARTVVTLSNPSQDQPVRSVVLDRRNP
ncbi:hypothetical protein CLV35_3098 [Motilibacter peucedani]|uniref:DUF1616 domain-containing protein n=1 Tax=Motilibacter peucedani TaxID=598650 RepID=A0A420XLD9_9ACTN|nr:hypothetical protein [Motilibacter peucedani]RKS71302.1 hypothetical protein CLV35_3098 [Motilibacter peucedani]